MASEVKKSTVHVISGGFGSNTKITLEDGTLIDGIVSAMVFLEPNAPTTLSLDIKGAVFDIEGEVTDVKFICPICGAELAHEHVQPDVIRMNGSTD